MSSNKQKPNIPKKRKRRMQLVLRPKQHISVDSEASTLRDSRLHATLTVNESNVQDETLNRTYQQQVSSDSEGSSLSDLEDSPVRDDMPVVTGRWNPAETDALMVAININRDALKFHFKGAGGGKEVKRQGWRDVTAYVNDVAHTHRTVAQCVSKTADYTQRAKDKYNKLRHRVGQTGGGAIPRNMRLKEAQEKDLDYLREEAVRGIPGIEPMDLGGRPTEPPSEKNLGLLWTPDRPNKQEYSKIPMSRMGVPKSMAKKKLSREQRLQKQARKRDHKRKMLTERKKEEEERKRIEQDRERGQKENERLQKLFIEKQTSKEQLQQRTKEKKDGLKILKEKAERKRARAVVRLQRQERRLKRQLDNLRNEREDEEDIEKKKERKKLRSEIRGLRAQIRGERAEKRTPDTPVDEN